MHFFVDPILWRGVRKRYLHEPNPTKVEMKRDTSYNEVLKMAVSIVFELYNPELDSLSLADSPLMFHLETLGHWGHSIKVMGFNQVDTSCMLLYR